MLSLRQPVVRLPLLLSYQTLHGGQLGLFLDVSAISVMEFGTWVVDEIKNQLFEERQCVSASHQNMITTEIPLSSAIPIMNLEN